MRGFDETISATTTTARFSMDGLDLVKKCANPISPGGDELPTDRAPGSSNDRTGGTRGGSATATECIGPRGAKCRHRWFAGGRARDSIDWWWWLGGFLHPVQGKLHSHRAHQVRLCNRYVGGLIEMPFVGVIFQFSDVCKR